MRDDASDVPAIEEIFDGIVDIVQGVTMCHELIELENQIARHFVSCQMALPFFGLLQLAITFSRRSSVTYSGISYARTGIDGWPG
jgi:hypothetical protein